MEDTKISKPLQNVLLVLSILIPVIGTAMAAISGNAWWFILLAPLLIWQEGGVGLAVLAVAVFLLTR